MAAHLAQSRNGNDRLGKYRPMSEINVTPMVDVMLVLLVIFMVAAPLLTVGVPVDLPKTEAPAINQPQQPLVITVNAQGKLFLQNAPVGDDQLVPRLEAITKANPNADIYVRGDQAISYGRVMQVMGMVSAAGFNKVSLITEPVTTPPAGQASGADNGNAGKQP
ncbi:MAG: protein TolR [Stellaceae bacterium]